MIFFQVTSCEHVFCRSCLVDCCGSYGQPTCPSCSIPITVDFSQNKDQEDHKNKMTLKGFKSTSILNRISLQDFHTSTKIDALVCTRYTFSYLFIYRRHRLFI